MSGGALRNASSISGSVKPFPRRNSRLLSFVEPWTCLGLGVVVEEEEGRG